MILLRTIPRSREGIITLANLAFDGAQAVGAEVLIEQNTAARIATDLYDYAGNPGAGTTGKRAAFDEARIAVFAAQAARRIAVNNGRAFCAKAIDLLKGYLGRTWTPQWNALGFAEASLRQQTNPLPRLICLREYFRNHAAHENAAQTITAAQADTLVTAIGTAEQTVVEKMQIRTLASKAQATALRTLTKRLTGLRTELDQLLEEDDPRWRRFGFSRPIDQRIPEEVAGLILTAGLPGQVVASWDSSARALDYRVTWSIQGGADDPTELPLVSDLAVTISGLPTGATVIVQVAARNSAGDALPAEAQMIVP